MDPTSVPTVSSTTQGVLTGGGIAGIIVAVVAVGRLTLDWLRQRSDGPVKHTTAAVADAEATNAMLLSSLREEREETARLSVRIEDLETQNGQLYQQIRDQRRDYEREVADLRNQLRTVSERLEEFQQRLRTDPPTVEQ